MCSSDKLAVDVMIWVVPRSKPILIPVVYKHLNVFKAKLLRFVAGIRNIQQRRHLFFILFGSKTFYIRSTDTRRVHAYNHKFSASLFSSSVINQCQYLDECQAMRKSSSFIEAF